MEVPAALVRACEDSQTPLMSSPQVTSVFIARVQSWLEDRLAPQTSMHGVLVDVFGVGLLLVWSAFFLPRRPRVHAERQGRLRRLLGGEPGPR